MNEDYYQLLGVDRKASADEIQKAYRALAAKFHPDVNPDDNAAKESFRRIQKAYDVLNDADKRQLYDQYGSSFEGASDPVPGGPAGGGAGFQDIDINQLFGGSGGGYAGAPAGFEGQFGDLFRRFTGGPRSARRRPTRGRDVKHQIEVPFQTAVLGGQAGLNVQRPSGKTETITVKIPPGIEDGKSIRLRGQGELTQSGGTAGDLLIRIRVASHPYFRRQGQNLEVNVAITLAEAVLGAKIDLPTPKGVITLTIPPGTSSGKRLRVKGHGVQSDGDDAGDLFAEVQVAVPESLDEDAKAMIRRINEQNPQSPRKDLRW
jgi:DnaJ-class molecular chaperone